MKYLLILIILAGCTSGTKKTVTTDASKDTTSNRTTVPDTSLADTHDPYETGKDTIRVNAAMAEILKFPEVQAISKQIEKNTNGKHSASIMVEDEYNGDSSYYDFTVGNNTNADRYETIYNFVMEKKTGKIKAYDPVNDTLLELKDWHKSTH